MTAFGETLDQVVRKRRESLLHRSQLGFPVITYMTPYIPLEILEASGAEYLSWEKMVSLYGVPDAYAEDGVPDQYFSRDFCVYSRLNFSLQLREPKPHIARFYVVYTCDAVAKMLEYFERVYPMHPVNLPRWKGTSGRKLWYNEIRLVHESLQDLTGNEIGVEALREAILTETRIRKKLADLCMMRTRPDFPLKSSDLYRLLQLRYLLGQEIYEGLVDETGLYVSENSIEDPTKKGAPIVLLLGSPLIDVPPGALGDPFCGEHIVDYVESFGVRTIEEPWRGITLQSISDPSQYDGADPIKMLADHYYERPMGAYVMPNDSRRMKNLELAAQFDVRAVLDFNYRGCEVFLAESRASEQVLRAKGIAYQHVQISGEKSGMEQLRTRIESFLYNLTGTCGTTGQE